MKKKIIYYTDISPREYRSDEMVYALYSLTQEEIAIMVRKG